MSNGATIVMKSPNSRKRSQDIMDYLTFKEEVACLQLQFDTKVKEFARKYGMEAYSKEVEAATADAKQGRIDLKELDYLIFFKRLRQKEILYHP
jgi:hypothetical protein